MSLPDKIFDAGIVGAGGAGFPTHVKANSSVEIFIANGAECEPLIHKDVQLMENFPVEIIDGMKLMIEQTNAKKGYFGLKSKNAAAKKAVESNLGNSKIEMSLLGDFYPAGDEYELVYHATGRLIPPYGIPLDIGCVVNNVETLLNIHKAANDKPVTRKFICVAGAVSDPSSFFVPVGTSFADAIKFAGGPSIENYAVFISGILMGRMTFDINEPITKTTGGLIILPRDHYLVKRNDRSIHDMNRIGKSACDQCSYCTELCPRYLLGYDVQPHKVMRSLEFTKSGKDLWNQYASLCCSCGLCTLYSCPEDLYPREACDQSKNEMKQKNIRYEQKKDVSVHPIKDGRKVPLKQLMKKLDIQKYERKTPFKKDFPEPSEVKILLKQHVGSPAEAVVKKGEHVVEGALIGKMPEAKLGAQVHASIAGIVKEVSDEFIIIG